jgi:hypothetical protein
LKDLDGTRKEIDWIKTVYADITVVAQDVEGLPAAIGVSKRDTLEGAPKRFHLAGKHDQSTHGRGGGRLRDTHVDGTSGKTGRVFESSFPEYTSSAENCWPDEMSERNSKSQRRLLEDDAILEAKRFDVDEDDMYGRIEGVKDEAHDFYDNAPLVHGTSAEGAAEIETEGLQSRKAMINETRAEVESMLPFDERDQILEDLDERGTTFPADKEAGLDEFVFMTHAEGAGYGEVNVVVDEAVLKQPGTFATADDIFAVHGGEMLTHAGDPSTDRGSVYKTEEFPDGVLNNYSKQVVNTHGSDYSDLAVDKYATVTASHEVVGSGMLEGSRSMEIKATKVAPENVIGYYTEDRNAAMTMVDKGVPIDKIVVGVPRGTDYSDIREDIRERTIEVPQAGIGNKSFGQNAAARNKVYKEMQNQWDKNWENPQDQRLDDIEELESQAGKARF